MKEKLKVVLLCHYWNDDVTAMMKCKHRDELSPWIQETINLYKNKNDVELHVVAPNYGTNKNSKFYRDNIHYHFFRYSIYYIPRLIIFLANLFTKKNKNGEGLFFKSNILTFYNYPKFNIKRIISKINPDLIQLYGSENLNYSVGVLSLKSKYPVIVTLQGFAYLQNFSKFFFVKLWHKQRINVERKINVNAKYITIWSSLDAFSPFKNEQLIFKLYPITKIPNILANTANKEYDIVFYARITEEKGIEDLIAAIGLLNRKNIRLKALIIGKSNDEYIEILKNKAKQQNIEDLLTFTGFIHDHEDVYKMASKAKLLVLPTHNDGLNNTIREAMFMKLPVVVNNVGGISIANNHQECITLTKLGDIEDLAGKIEIVLNDTERTERLINNAYEEMLKYYSPEGVYQATLDIFKKVLETNIQSN